METKEKSSNWGEEQSQDIFKKQVIHFGGRKKYIYIQIWVLPLISLHTVNANHYHHSDSLTYKGFCIPSR